MMNSLGILFLQLKSFKIMTRNITNVFYFRFCLFPQEIVLKMDPPVRIKKLQILSHQHLIASRIELYISNMSSTSLDRAKFDRLGYISLSDNTMTGYRVNLFCHLLIAVFRHVLSALDTQGQIKVS